MTTLIVALPPKPSALTMAHTDYAFALTRTGQQLDAHGQEAAVNWPAADGLVLAVPPQCLSWHRVTSPKVPAKRLRAALEGLLEERLLKDVSQTALAVSPSTLADGSVWVAAMDKSHLQTAMETFAALGRSVNRVVPLLPPLEANTAEPSDPIVHVLGEPETATVVQQSDQGVLCVPLAHALTLLPQSANPPTLLSLPALATVTQQHMQQSPQVQPLSTYLLQAAQSAWQLAQFDLRPAKDQHIWTRLQLLWQALAYSPQWRAWRYAALALLVVNVAGLRIWAWQQERALATKTELAKEVLSQTFPDVKPIVDAPLQMSRALQSLQQSTGATQLNDFDHLLTVLGQHDWSGQTPQELSYDAGRLTLVNWSAPEGQWQQAAAQLATMGLQMRKDGANSVIEPQANLSERPK